MQHAKNRIEALLKYFTEVYLEEYKISLIKFVKNEILEHPPSPYRLLAPAPDTEDIISGWMTKEGGTVKNWKRRFAVMKYDYSIEYFAAEPVEGKKNKPKGIIYPCGYELVENPTEEQPERQHCVSLAHDRRRNWFLDFDDEETKKEWIQKIQSAVENAGAPLNKDIVARTAFQKAYRRARWYGSCWTYYKLDADEGTMLGELITYCVSRDCADALFKGKSDFARKAVDKVLAKTINTMVFAAWKSACAAVTSMREAIEGPLKTSMEPLVKLEQDLAKKLDELARPGLMPLVEEHVVPPLANILGCVTGDIFEAFSSYLGEFQARTTDMITKIKAANTLEEMTKLCYWSTRHFKWGGWGGLREPTKHLSKFIKPLSEFPFDHFRPWRFKRAGYLAMADLSRNAYFTLESLVKGAVKEGADVASAIDAAAIETTERLVHDTRLAIMQYITDGLLMIIWDPLARVALPALSKLTSPLDSMIPGPLKNFIVLGDLLENFINGVVVDTCRMAVDTAASQRVDALSL
eukprot:gnl/Dysnectes_brevis/527_a584_6623.p1 GENE.gnl/Dysnectes_brevis/527_a584_6623~~gnl/Dysnectes_brevis/527_a584_6623.p1  ORF type:complete len:533 (+),score=178.58 gnl/Dysnectes_brevis/527_a584_6623:35-1600(+)